MVKLCGADEHVPMKHRYVADTESDEVCDVLNKRTSEKNGAAPTTDAAAGSVSLSAETEAGAATRVAATSQRRAAILFMEASPPRETKGAPAP
jgi:hypothetical protein